MYYLYSEADGKEKILYSGENLKEVEAERQKLINFCVSECKQSIEEPETDLKIYED